MNWWERLKEQPKRDRFAQRVIEALRAAGTTEKLAYDPHKFQIVLKAKGQEFERLQMNLTNIYADYQAAPKNKRRAVIERFIRGTRYVELPAGFAQVRERLVPRVRSRCYYTMLDLRLQMRNSLPRPNIYRPLGEHLAVGLAVDQKDGIIEVFGDMLHEWGIGVEDAFALAHENLRRKSPASLSSLAPGLYHSPCCDNHDASRLVLDDLVRECEVKGDYVAMVPNRDTLLLTGDDDLEGLRGMLQVAEGVLRDKPRPMSGDPVRLRNGVWESYAPDEFYPDLRQYRFLHMQGLSQDYAEQKELLDQVYTKAEKDMFVPGFSVLQNTETGTLRSYSIWADGGHALLPRTDLVFFMRMTAEGEGSVEANADWEHVFAVVGDRMKQTEDYPPRFLVESFPSEDELQRIGKEND